MARADNSKCLLWWFPLTDISLIYHQEPDQVAGSRRPAAQHHYFFPTDLIQGC